MQSELEECVGEGRTVCVSHKASLPYLDSVINEVMRITPVSPVLIPHTTLTHTPSHTPGNTHTPSHTHLHYV